MWSASLGTYPKAAYAALTSCGENYRATLNSCRSWTL